MFYLPTSPLGVYDGAAYLEPRVYTVCAAPVAKADCQTVTLHPQSDVVIGPPRGMRAVAIAP